MSNLQRKTILLCLDGCSPEYLESVTLPNINAMMKDGSYAQASSVMPSVTNVNNASILSGRFPEKHGIVTNYYYDREEAISHYMENAGYLLCETLLQRAKRRGLSTGLVTAKDKLKDLLHQGADVAVSAERPPQFLTDLLGPAPSLYSVEANWWLLQAAAIVLRDRAIDILYISTTDYVMHMFPPGHATSNRHLQRLDELIGQLVSIAPHADFYITADHGMNQKSFAVDPQDLLLYGGLRAVAVPIIKDKHTVHHQNMGGSIYIYLNDIDDAESAREILMNTKGIETVYTRAEAAQAFRLLESRIGDLLVLADKETVFASLGSARSAIKVRSHGSVHESVVPIIAYPARFDTCCKLFNCTIAGLIEPRLGI